ncbi:MAG: helix-turn-helix domain-containing protein [Bifidobacterium sp.]|nr:helix-turn-helix domain-containing protein [Bifidobacterium sp.]
MEAPTITPQLDAWDMLQWRISRAADPADVLMTTAEAAAYLGVSENALGVRRHNDSGPTYLKRGRFIRYRKSDIDAWLQEQTNATADTTEN